MTYQTYTNPFDLNYTQDIFFHIFQYANDITGGFFSPILLCALFFVSMLRFQDSPYKEKALLASSFTTFVGAFILFGFGQLMPQYFIIFTLLLIGATYLNSRWNQ